MNSSLWLTAERRALLRRLAASPSTSPAWFRQLLNSVPAGSSPGAAIHNEPDGTARDPAAALALRGFLDADPAAAGEAIDAWLGDFPPLDRVSDLGKAHLALLGAVLCDLNHDLWSPERLDLWRDTSIRLLEAFFHLSPGNPHHVGNNWWAVTHAGMHMLAAALSSRGLDPEIPLAARSISEIEQWAWGRLDAFLNHFGDAGAYHEGLGYQNYACSYLLPSALLYEVRTGRSVAVRHPGLRRMAELLLLSAIEGPAFSDTSGRRAGWGRQLSWNDAGLEWPESAVALLALRWAPPEKLPALLERWSRLSGPLRPDGWPAARFSPLFFIAAFHPEADSIEAPVSEPLPLSICDRKQGLWFSRDAHSSPADAVLGAYARACHPSGHSQHDAGSFRFSALGWDWVIGGGQARPEPQWQSVVISSDPVQKTARCGLVIHESERAFGMDLRAALAGYGERHLALHPAAGKAPLAVAILDLIDDHRSDRDWFWRMTTTPEHAFAPADDGLGFTLAAPDGASLEARFLGEAPLALCLEQSPPSTRTFAGGDVKNYLSRPCVVASFNRRRSLAIYVLLTVRPPGAVLPSPALLPDGGLDVAWGGDAVWHRPFGVALPDRVPPSRLRGQSPHPAPLPRSPDGKGIEVAKRLRPDVFPGT